MNDMIIKKTIISRLLGNNTYILHREGSSKAIVIDPSRVYAQLNKYFNDNKIDEISVLLTHAHFDHMWCLDELIKNYKTTVYVQKFDEEKLTDNDKNVATSMNTTLPPLKADVLLNGDESLSIYGIDIKVIYTPGHSKGCVTYMIGNDLYVGDLIIQHSYGRVDFYDGNFDSIFDSIVNKIFSLNGDLTIYSGHGAPMSLDFERQHNEILADYGI